MKTLMWWPKSKQASHWEVLPFAVTAFGNRLSTPCKRCDGPSMRPLPLLVPLSSLPCLLVCAWGAWSMVTFSRVLRRPIMPTSKLMRQCISQSVVLHEPFGAPTCRVERAMFWRAWWGLPRQQRPLQLHFWLDLSLLWALPSFKQARMLSALRNKCWVG